MFYADIFPTPLGLAIAVADDNTALTQLFLHPNGDISHVPALRVPGDQLTWSKGRLAPITKQLTEYFQGERTTFDLPLAPQGTPFQRQVWDAIAGIPYGETRTYAQLANQLGSSNACRAVGGASGKNPIWIVVPCHRVLGANGALTGYAGGLSAKQHLLTLEGRAGSLLAAARP